MKIYIVWNTSDANVKQAYPLRIFKTKKEAESFVKWICKNSNFTKNVLQIDPYLIDTFSKGEKNDL